MSQGNPIKAIDTSFLWRRKINNKIHDLVSSFFFTHLLIMWTDMAYIHREEKKQ